MTKKYTIIQVFCSPPFDEILMADLGMNGFDSFIELENGFQTSLESSLFNEETIRRIIGRIKNVGPVGYHIGEIEEKNWNEEWEKSYDPVIVDDQCLIRSTFHTIEKKYPLEIIINPKMSFGTGHHDTTCLMIENLLKIDQQNKKVLDAGCGTGILSILAEKKGALQVLGFDIDPWAISNSEENVILNNCQTINIIQGNVHSIRKTLLFDSILANINRNVIFDDLPAYAGHLDNNGFFITSGFFIQDAELIIEKARKSGLSLQHQKNRNKWSSLVFQKKTN